MNSIDKHTVWRTGAIAVAVFLLGAPGPAAGQALDCGRLRAAIRASEGDNAQRDTGAFDRAASQQRYEMDRTRRYAAQIGCGREDAGFLGDGPPPECQDIEDRLARMQNNLDRMEQRANDNQRADGSARHAALLSRYNTSCAGAATGPAQLPQDAFTGPPIDDTQNPANLGTPGDPDDLSTVPLNGDIMQGGGGHDRVSGRTICVRTCDGGYFPLAPRATTDQLDGLEQLCKASCPNTEARLYTMRDGGLAAATAIDGSTYMALPTAFGFEKSFSPACTCKPPDKSWAQALDGAEQLLEKGDRSDVTVTAALSDRMAKPLAASAAAPSKSKGAKGTQPLLPDRKTADEGLRAVQAPTASHDSSGIGGPAAAARVLGRSDGLKITTAGPDGATKQIRLIVP